MHRESDEKYIKIKHRSIKDKCTLTMAVSGGCGDGNGGSGGSSGDVADITDFPFFMPNLLIPYK